MLGLRLFLRRLEKNPNRTEVKLHKLPEIGAGLVQLPEDFENLVQRLQHLRRLLSQNYLTDIGYHQRTEQRYLDSVDPYAAAKRL